MKRISNSDLQAGLTCPYEEVKEAYLIYALEKWLTSQNYGPQSFAEVEKLQSSLSADLLGFVRDNVKVFLPRLIARTKGIDFAKVDWLLQDEVHLGKDFSFSIAYVTLLNLDAYPNAGLNRIPKKCLVEQMQNVLSKIDDMEVWERLFSLNKPSLLGLDTFSAWMQNQEKESCLDNSVVYILCEHAKIHACFAKKVFAISLYLIGNFRGYITEVVEILNDFCQCYPMFRKKLENFLFKNFDRYFWKLNPYPHRVPLEYYKEMMEHLTSRKLSFSLSWKMKIVQKMLNQAEDRAVVIYLLDNLRKIYDFQVENADEAYFEAIKTGLCKQEIRGNDVLDIVNSFANGSIFNASGPWWRKFAEYPLAFQKTMVMVYSSSKLPENYLMQAFFALVQMNQANPWLFDDFEKLALSILAKNWEINGQKIVSCMKVFQYSPYSDAKFSYIEQGICKLLKIADDKQIEVLKELKSILPFYDKISEIKDLQEKWSEIEAKKAQEELKRKEDWKEIDRLLSKIQ